MTRPILNLNELEFETVGNHKQFVAKRAPVSSRIGAEKLGKEYPVSKGDFICCPANPGQPHQLTNSSSNPLTYLALSNRVSADVMHCPDSGKCGVWQGDSSDPSGPGSFVAFVKDTAAVDYGDGEDNDQ